MRLNYPLKFEPILKERIWGGKKLMSDFGKHSDKENVGESWEVSAVEGDVSVVANGSLKGSSLQGLVAEFRWHFVGGDVFAKFGDNFPILIKFIDAKTPLSIQVHPSDELSNERHNSFGKNEMWYIMDADEDAELIVGFNKKVSQAEYKEVLERGNVLDILNSEKIQPGDTFYIPTGRVHAIGAGTVLAEIQQTSDITYRIYDYNRLDAVSKQPRELHTELALDAIDFGVYDSYKTDYEVEKNISVDLVDSPYFKTNIISLDGEMQLDYGSKDSFVILMCVEGSLTVECVGGAEVISRGETVLLPASIAQCKLQSSGAKILEVYL